MKKSSNKQKYSRLKKLLNVKNKAHSEEEASKNPKAFMEKMHNASIKKVKGIAF